MADEQPEEAVDPLQGIMETHLARMKEIVDTSFDTTKTAMGDVLTRLNRNVGLKDAVLDQTLTALGINPGGK